MDSEAPATDPPADTLDGEHDELEHATKNELENPCVIGVFHAARTKHGMCHADFGQPPVILRVRRTALRDRARWAEPHTPLHSAMAARVGA